MNLFLTILVAYLGGLITAAALYATWVVIHLPDDDELAGYDWEDDDHEGP